MAYIVHGATGAQGSPVLTALQSAGKEPIAAVREPRNAPEGIAAVAADLADMESLTAAYRGAEGIFVHLPMGAPQDALAQAKAIAAAVAAAGPGRVVISTSGQIVDQTDSPLQMPFDSPIQTLIREVRATGISTAVVAPRLYLENLLLPVIAEPVKHEGVLRYPLPASFPASWSSHLDVAEIAARLLIDTTTTGTVSVGHLPGLTGSDLADAFAGHESRDVRFEPITPSEFGELITPLFGATAAPVVSFYEALNTQEQNTIDESTSAQALLGLAPRSVAHWLSDLGR